MLKRILLTMEVPPARLDLTKFSNVLWLNRNLGARNLKHHRYNDAMKRIRYILSINKDK